MYLISFKKFEGIFWRLKFRIVQITSCNVAFLYLQVYSGMLKSISLFVFQTAKEKTQRLARSQAQMLPRAFYKFHIPFFLLHCWISLNFLSNLEKHNFALLSSTIFSLRSFLPFIGIVLLKSSTLRWWNYCLPLYFISHSSHLNIYFIFSRPTCVRQVNCSHQNINVFNPFNGKTLTFLYSYWLFDIVGFSHLIFSSSRSLTASLWLRKSQIEEENS